MFFFFVINKRGSFKGSGLARLIKQIRILQNTSLSPQLKCPATPFKNTLTSLYCLAVTRERGTEDVIFQVASREACPCTREFTSMAFLICICLNVSSFLIQYRFKRYFWNLICPLKYYKTNLKLLSLQIKLRSSKSMSSIFFRQSVSFSISAAKQNPFLYFLQYNSQQQQNLSFILNIIFLTLIIYFHKILQYFKIFI